MKKIRSASYVVIIVIISILGSIVYLSYQAYSQISFASKYSEMLIENIRYQAVHSKNAEPDLSKVWTGFPVHGASPSELRFRARGLQCHVDKSIYSKGWIVRVEIGSPPLVTKVLKVERSGLTIAHIESSRLNLIGWLSQHR